MIVVAIVGILAAIALPAYQDYVVRSKMSESLAAIAACKTSVAEFASSHSSYPADETQAGCSTTPTTHVASLTVAGTGAITVISQNTNTIAECTLTLTPGAAPTAITNWLGTFAVCPSKYVPSSFR